MYYYLLICHDHDLLTFQGHDLLIYLSTDFDVLDDVGCDLGMTEDAFGLVVSADRRDAEAEKVNKSRNFQKFSNSILFFCSFHALYQWI